jgi:hypothetical protein
MQLGLGTTDVYLQDGLGTWNNSAADALATWAGYLDFISPASVSEASVPETSGDGVNSVFFSSTVFGEAFGGDTLAVTVLLQSPSNSKLTREADVVVNNGYHFDSYRGPLQTSAADIHRILLHAPATDLSFR